MSLPKNTRVLENKELERVHPSLNSWENPLRVCEKMRFTFSSVKEERIINSFYRVIWEGMVLRITPAIVEKKCSYVYL